MNNLEQDIMSAVLPQSLQGSEVSDGILDVVGMKDFENDLDGVAPDMEKALLQHILKTRNVIATSPKLIENQQNSTQLLQMYNYLIENWNDVRTRVIAIKLLAIQEKELVSKGYISYDFSDLDMSDTAEHSGFFSVLAELYQEEISFLDGLDGFWSKIKKGLKKVATVHKKVYNWHKKAVKNIVSVHKKVFKKVVDIHKKGFKKFVKILPKINKFNPLTIAVRNALRGLLLINFLGMASSLNQKDTKGVMTKVSKLYKFMGGKQSKLCSAIKKGARKKPLFNKKFQRKLEKSKAKKLRGIDEDLDFYNDEIINSNEVLKGLGEPFTIAGMLTAAGGFLLKIWSWIKNAGIKIYKGVQKVSKSKIVQNIVKKRPEQSSQIPTDMSERNNVETFTKQNDSGGTMRFKSNNQGQKNNAEDDKKKKLKKIGIIAVSIFAVGGIFYGAYKLNEKDKKAPKTKLNGIELK